MYEALMANSVWTGAKGEAKWRKGGRCMYKYFDWIVEGKGADERKEGTFGSKMIMRKSWMYLPVKPSLRLFKN